MKPEREPVLPMPSRDAFLEEKKGRGPQQVAAAMATNPNSMAANAPREAAPQDVPQIPSVPVDSKVQAVYQPLLRAAVKAGEISPEQATDLNELYSKRGIPAPNDERSYAMIPPGTLYVNAKGEIKKKKRA